MTKKELKVKAFAEEVLAEAIKIVDSRTITNKLKSADEVRYCTKTGGIQLAWYKVEKKN